jgi:hypothetical protein
MALPAARPRAPSNIRASRNCHGAHYDLLRVGVYGFVVRVRRENTAANRYRGCSRHQNSTADRTLKFHCSGNSIDTRQAPIIPASGESRISFQPCAHTQIKRPPSGGPESVTEVTYSWAAGDVRRRVSGHGARTAHAADCCGGRYRLRTLRRVRGTTTRRARQHIAHTCAACGAQRD